ncbi:MAG: hypothetical protein M1152_00750 [Actinobacteria bacterium]|nr:hypothetical protein [Actinomycetota bacterium]
MPWCKECNKLYEEEELKENRECPACGELLASKRKAPWHFKVLLIGTCSYLGWRAYQGITWLVHHL